MKGESVRESKGGRRKRGIKMLAFDPSLDGIPETRQVGGYLFLSLSFKPD